MFASAPPRRGTSVAWLEPGRRRRRRGRGPSVVGLVALLVVAGVAAGGFLYLRERQRVDQRHDAVASFVRAWTRGDERGMWAVLDERSRGAYTRARFRRAYASANRAATVKAVRAGEVPNPHDGKVTVPVAVSTRLFGTLRGGVAIPVHDEAGDARIAWSPALRLPSLRAGERVRRRILSRPERASVLGADGRRLDGDPALAAIAGTPPSGGDAGTGLEALYDARLAGRPGAQLRYGSRVVARFKRRRGHSVHATIRPGLQRATLSALG